MAPDTSIFFLPPTTLHRTSTPRAFLPGLAQALTAWRAQRDYAADTLLRLQTPTTRLRSTYLPTYARAMAQRARAPLPPPPAAALLLDGFSTAPPLYISAPRRGARKKNNATDAARPRAIELISTRRA